MVPNRQGDIFSHRERIEQRPTLKEHTKLASHLLQGAFIEVRDLLAVEVNLATIRLIGTDEMS